MLLLLLKLRGGMMIKVKTLTGVCVCVCQGHTMADASGGRYKKTQGSVRL
jgi:hypothetical protein